MTGDELRELQDRGRFFYQGFPGAAAAEEWKRFQDRAKPEQTGTLESPADASDPASTVNTPTAMISQVLAADA
jgi:hypothetical protein